MAKKQLHQGAKWLFRVRGLFSALFFAVFISVFSSSFLASALSLTPEKVLSSLILIVSTTLILLIILVEVYARLSYRFWSYEFTDSQLRIERGIIWKRYSNIPYERIQNVDITRGIIARICGFSSVNIQTAGFSSPATNHSGLMAEGHIPAVPVDEAEKIREFVMKKITRKGDRGL